MYSLPEIAEVSLSKETLEGIEELDEDSKATSLLVECFKDIMEKYEAAMFTNDLEDEALKINEEMYTLSKILIF